MITIQRLKDGLSNSNYRTDRIFLAFLILGIVILMDCLTRNQLTRSDLTEAEGKVFVCRINTIRSYGKFRHVNYYFEVKTFEHKAWLRIAEVFTENDEKYRHFFNENRTQLKFLVKRKDYDKLNEDVIITPLSLVTDLNENVINLNLALFDHNDNLKTFTYVSIGFIIASIFYFMTFGFFKSANTK